MSLHSLSVGDQGSRIVLLHGLFGQGRNWSTIGKAVQRDHRVTMLDLPDHGRSPWSERFDYLRIADQVADAIEGGGESGETVTLVGHSMGGKVAMVLALRHPHRVRRLLVADMSPVRYRGFADGEDRSDQERPGIPAYLRAMNRMDLGAVAGREDADAQLASAVPDPSVRAFLLQNLRRDDGPSGWRWQANLAMLQRDLAALGDWPEAELAGVDPYPGAVLWVAGEQSDYVREEFEPAMDRWFPRHRKVVVKNAGHWLHSEQPEVFAEILARFAAD